MFMHPMEILGMHYALLQSKIHGVVISVPARVLVWGKFVFFIDESTCMCSAILLIAHA